MRLDVFLVEKGLAPSRERAKELIRNGQVLVNGTVRTKPAFETAPDDEATVTGETLKYVSRGGLKLEKALEVFRPEIKGLVCMDIGASTGGFTDCLLQNGAAKVYAVDVGTGQLAESLLQDSRVVNREKTNVRYLEPEDFTEPIDFITADVSFISLKLVLPSVYRLLKDGGACIVLIKPQFEAGKGNLNKKGVVTSEKIREAVVKDITAFSETLHFQPCGLETSPIKGPEGNTEYLLYLKKAAPQTAPAEEPV